MTLTYGIEKGKRAQLGVETDHGTAVAATFIWPGPADWIEQKATVVDPKLDIGKSVKVGGHSYISSLAATYAMQDGEAWYECLPYIFGSGIVYTAGTANGGSTTATVFSYPISTAYPADTTVKSYTIEAGDNSKAYEMEYAIVDNFSLMGAVGQALMLSANWFGRQRSPSTFTAGQAIPTPLEQINFSAAKLYLDASGGTIGATQIVGTFIGLTLDVVTGWIPVPSADGQLYFTLAKYVGATVKGKIKFEYNDNAHAVEANYLARDYLKLRIDFPGTALAGTGGTYTTKLLRMDSYISITDVPKPGADKGDNVLEFGFEAEDNGTLFTTFTVVKV